MWFADDRVKIDSPRGENEFYLHLNTSIYTTGQADVMGRRYEGVIPSKEHLTQSSYNNNNNNNNNNNIYLLQLGCYPVAVAVEVSSIAWLSL